MKNFFLVLGIAAFATLASVGCAESSDDPAADGVGGDENDLTARQLPGVVAVELAEVRNQQTVLSTKTVGAPKKVSGILTGVKKLGAHESIPRCLERDTTRMTFLDVTGKKLATVSSYCGGYGSIAFENGSQGYGVKFNAQGVDAARSAPFAVGDALWGTTTIEISKPGASAQTKTVTGEATKPILAGFDLNAVPDATASFPRCLPSHSVTFKRADKSVAFSSFLCGTGGEPPASVSARFTAVDPAAQPDTAPLANGAVTIDPRPIISALAATP